MFIFAILQFCSHQVSNALYPSQRDREGALIKPFQANIYYFHSKQANWIIHICRCDLMDVKYGWNEIWLAKFIQIDNWWKLKLHIHANTIANPNNQYGAHNSVHECTLADEWVCVRIRAKFYGSRSALAKISITTKRTRKNTKKKKINNNGEMREKKGTLKSRTPDT